MARTDPTGWGQYVPVPDRKLQAARLISRLLRKGKKLSPVRLKGRVIASTFWGKAWCDNLLSYSDYANRLPRGQRYVRNGSVIDLQVEPGLITALVSGSDIYTVSVAIRPVAAGRWTRMVKRCAGKVDSAVELLRGRLSSGVMQIIAQRESGLFPGPKAIRMECSCPDWAVMCKHVAAVLYGVGARLDLHPELLFVLRGVDHLDLIAKAPMGLARRKAGASRRRRPARLEEVLFGIELDED
ncbi:MAG: SWIM zinc finger family protein [bacterium]